MSSPGCTKSSNASWQPCCILTMKCGPWDWEPLWQDFHATIRRTIRSLTRNQFLGNCYTGCWARHIKEMMEHGSSGLWCEASWWMAKDMSWLQWWIMICCSISLEHDSLVVRHGKTWEITAGQATSHWCWWGNIWFYANCDQSIYGGSLKWGDTPQIHILIGFSWIFHYKPHPFGSIPPLENPSHPIPMHPRQRQREGPQ